MMTSNSATHGPGISDALIACATAGMFPKAFFSLRDFEELSFAAVLRNGFEKRAYQVRHPVPADLGELCELETACWPGPLRAPADELRARIERFPSGHCVMEMDGRLVGAIYSQRIAAIESLKTTTCTNVAALHQADGPYVQLLAVTVLPETQNLGLGDQLLEFMLHYCSARKGVARIVAVSLCKEYHRYPSLTMESYIRARDEFGYLKDPILRFHESHGGRISGLCPGYRPQDQDNRCTGVLVEYDIVNRRPGNGRTPVPAAVTHANECWTGPALPLVEECVRRVMGEVTPWSFSPARPLMEMGLDSLKLMALRALLGNRLGRELDAAFFFRYGTPEKIARFFDEGDATEEDTTLCVAPLSRTEVDHPTKNAQRIQAVCCAPDLSDKTVAIVGMACRFPGGGDTMEDFWTLLANGTDAVTEIPVDRWDVAQYYDPDPRHSGGIISRHGGFLRDVDRFDAHFFNISPREAAAMDPQQRLLLSLSWEALEHAGINPATLAGTRTGVFVGLFSHDYETLQVKGSTAAAAPVFDDTYFATGNSAAVAAGRLAYYFGFEGPALAIDTACSSSLVAVHQACRSLRSGETDIALAAGVNLILSPELSMAFSRAGMLSPSGRCNTFDAAADGYVRGEGCAVVVLKRLSRALADGDRVLAVVKGSAINQDGASNGLTAPNGLAQEAVIRDALTDAGIAAHEVSYIEAHGTGTALGDPVEVSALANVYGQGRSADNPLLIGSVKANIGHTEAAAGIAGLIKVVLAMQHHHIPMQPHFRQLNPLIALATIPAAIPVAGTDWQAGTPGHRLLAGVSSFGFSGTNAHVVLQEAPEALRACTNAPERPLHMLTLSAKNDDGLDRLIDKYTSFLDSPAAHDRLADICYTANAGRAHFSSRIGIVAQSVANLRDKLRTREGAGVSRGNAVSPPRIAFLFTGQGAQFAGMGKDLYATQPTFRKALDRCAALLQEQLERPLLEVIYPGKNDHGLVDQTAYTQPALFAIEYALCCLWKSWGVAPDAVIGHSVGEYAAACAAGVFTLEDGLTLIAARGRLMQALPRDGAMAAVFAEEKVVAAAIAPFRAGISLAALNGPRLNVISGLATLLAKVTEALAAQGVKVAMLNVSHAFHSPLMDPVLEPFGTLAREIRYTPPRIDLISNLTGEAIGEAIASPAYWVTHIREAVRFAAGIQALYRKGYRVFVEIGPHPVLTGMAKMCLSDSPEDTPCVWLPSLMRGKPDWAQMLTSLGALYTQGAQIDWQGFDAAYTRSKLALPTYPFEGRRHWIPTAQAGNKKLPAAHIASQSPTCSSEESLNDLLYRIAWVPQKIAPQKGSNALPSPITVKEAVTAFAAGQVSAYPDLLTAMEALSVAYVHDTLARMGWTYPIGSRFTTDDAAGALRVAEAYRPLLGRLLGILAEEGILYRDAQGWTVAQSLRAQSAGEQWRQLVATHPEAEAELALLGRCGAGLIGVLQGACDPIGLVFPEADLTMAVQLYEDSLTFGAMNRVVAHTLSVVLADHAGGRKLRILEIGAGTGGTTAAILPLLKGEQVDYVFTDVSAHFLSQAKERFANYPFVRYQLLDIEKDPVSQGYRPHTVDVIIAANVIHATADIRHTLQRAGQLLAPGGMLMLLEGIARRRWMDMIFGLLDGWWKFTDHDLRPAHPLMDVATWESVMHSSGFAETAAITPGQGGMLFEQAVILGRTLPEAKQTPAASQRHWLILSDGLSCADGSDGLSCTDGSDGLSCMDGSDGLSYACGADSASDAEGSYGGPEADGVGARLSGLLGARGDHVTMVFPGERFSRTSDGAYTVNPAERDDFQRLLRAVASEGKSALHGILHLWSLDAPQPSESDVATESVRLCTGMLHLVQALIRMDAEPPPGLWQVTRHAVGADGTERLLSGLVQAPLWGMAQVIAVEHPELTCVRVDIDRGADCVASLLEEILQGQPADRIALRGKARYAARLVPFQSDAGPDRDTAVIRSDGTYLISGGLGGTGLEIAAHLVAHGAGQLVLVSRSGQPAEGSPPAAAIRQMQQAGARIVVAQADVSRKSDVHAVLKAIAASDMPLKGVVHAAGVFEDRLLADHAGEFFKKVFAAKVAGAWNLHAATREIPLDVFMLFSSATSFVCSSGLGNYVAANAFLDALAHYRRLIGLPGLSISWGPWAGTGMAAAVGKRRETQWAAQGFGLLAPATALSVFHRLLGTTDPQVTAMAMDWPCFFGQQTDTLPDFLDHIPQHPADRPASCESIYDTLQAAPREHHQDLLRAYIASMVASVLSLPTAAINLRQGFFQMGMDSLTSMELRNRLQKVFACTLPATLIFKYPTVVSLVDHLIETVVHPAPATACAPAATTATVVVEEGQAKEDRVAIDDLTDNEAEALLLARLENLRY